MIRRKVWGLTDNWHDFALFQKILRSQPSSSRSRSTRQSRPSQARVGGESPNVHIDQPAFVINGERISSDHLIWRGRGFWTLSSYEHPVRCDETGQRCGIDLGTCTRSRNQVMTVPTGTTDRPPVCRRVSRPNAGSAVGGVPLKTPPDQIRNRRRIGDRWSTVA
jgi:hypothetical protein